MSRYRYRRTPSEVAKIVLGWVIFLTVVYVVAALCAGVVHSDLSVSTSQVLKQGWGIDSAKPQSLQLGGNTSGSVGNFTLYDYTGTGSIQPASAIKLGLRNQGVDYILVVPTTKVRFHQTAETPEGANVRLTLDGDNLSFQIGWPGGWWRFGQNPLPNVKTSSSWSYYEEVGPAAFLTEHLAMVDVSLTPQQYNNYLS